MIHSDRILVTSGVVASTFGTAVDFTFPDTARGLLAMCILNVVAADTAAEGHSQIMRVNSTSLGLADQRLVVGSVMTSGPATNNSGRSSTIDIIPFDLKLNGNEKISIDLAPAGASTAGDKAEVGFLFYDQGGVPSDWLSHFPQILPIRGGYAQNAQQLTTTRTALTAISTPSWATAIVGVKGVITKTGAITAAEYGLGYFDLATTIQGTEPQKYPASFGSGATLGTPVGTGIHAEYVPWIPTYIPLPAATQTITPYIVLDNAITTDNRVAVAVAWR